VQDYIQEYTSNSSEMIFRLGNEGNPVVRKKATVISINTNLQKKDKIFRNFWRTNEI
jgi:hypothetical protein